MNDILEAPGSGGLRRKLVRATVLLLAAVGLVIGMVIAGVEVLIAQRSVAQMEREIQRTLTTRGESMVKSHADVFSGFVRDTALTEMQHTLRTSVEQSDVIYGLFTDADGRPWAYCSPRAPCKSGVDDLRVHVVDAGQVAHDLHLSAPLLPLSSPVQRTFEAFGHSVTEFASPVLVDTKAAGTLRYGISTDGLHRALQAARAERRALSLLALLSIVAIVMVAMLVALALMRRVATRITLPLDELTRAADKMAQGDRNAAVKIRSGDELERLGAAFNSMVQDVRASYSALEENNRALAKEIEDRRQAQAERTEMQNYLIQSQKMEAFGQLAGGVAHDFNNILAVIVGNSELLDEMLADQAVDAEVRQFNQSVLAAAERGANLTRQLLTFARKEKDNPKPLDLNATLTSFEKLIRRLLEENVTIFIEKAPRVPLVYVDAGRVEQVLMNLCVNARDAMPAGGRLTLRTTSLQLDHSLSVTTGLLPRGKYVLVEAEDTGTGISPEVVARIFEPFFTTKHAGQGTGLGLATVHGIVRAAGGAIDVRSELGVGTTFKVYFPAYESELAEEEPLRRERVLPVDGKRVLLCEDEETVRTMTEHILTRNGYVVTATGSPLEALAILRERRMDLLITDVIMPEMNGSQLITRAREMDPNLPVLFVSGYTAGVLVAQKLSESDSSFLRKPYRAHDLLSHAQSLVDRKPSEPSTKPS